MFGYELLRGSGASTPLSASTSRETEDEPGDNAWFGSQLPEVVGQQDAGLDVSELATSPLNGVASLLGAGAEPSLFGLLGASSDPEVVDEVVPTNFSTAAIAAFPILDIDGDGYVSTADINSAMVNPELTPDQAAVVATLKLLQGELETLHYDEEALENPFSETTPLPMGVTMEDLIEFQHTGRAPEELRNNAESQFGFGQWRIANSSSEVFTNGLPDVNAMQQGSIGDCWFLAALGSAVAQDPQAVADMIAPNEDGTYTVTFPNGQSATVAAPTSAEIALYATSGGDGMWATLIERAFARIQDPDVQPYTGVPQDDIDGGRLLPSGVNMFSANGSSNLDLMPLNDIGTTADRLAEAFGDGRVVTAGIRSGLPILEPDGRREGLPMGHAYSVVAYDAQNGFVTLRNPWGHDEWTGPDGTQGADNDGTFTLTLEEFDQLFTTVCYADAAPTAAQEEENAERHVESARAQVAEDTALRQRWIDEEAARRDREAGEQVAYLQDEDELAEAGREHDRQETFNTCIDEGWYSTWEECDDEAAHLAPTVSELEDRIEANQEIVDDYDEAHRVEAPPSRGSSGSSEPLYIPHPTPQINRPQS